MPRGENPSIQPENKGLETEPLLESERQEDEEQKTPHHVVSEYADKFRDGFDERLEREKKELNRGFLKREIKGPFYQEIARIAEEFMIHGPEIKVLIKVDDKKIPLDHPDAVNAVCSSLGLFLDSCKEFWVGAYQQPHIGAKTWKAFRRWTRNEIIGNMRNDILACIEAGKKSSSVQAKAQEPSIPQKPEDGLSRKERRRRAREKRFQFDTEGSIPGEVQKTKQEIDIAPEAGPSTTGIHLPSDETDFTEPTPSDLHDKGEVFSDQVLDRVVSETSVPSEPLPDQRRKEEIERILEDISIRLDSLSPEAANASLPIKKVIGDVLMAVMLKDRGLIEDELRGLFTEIGKLESESYKVIEGQDALIDELRQTVRDLREQVRDIKDKGVQVEPEQEQQVSPENKLDLREKELHAQQEIIGNRVLGATDRVERITSWIDRAQGIIHSLRSEQEIEARGYRKDLITTQTQAERDRITEDLKAMGGDVERTIQQMNPEIERLEGELEASQRVLIGLREELQRVEGDLRHIERLRRPLAPLSESSPTESGEINLKQLPGDTSDFIDKVLTGEKPSLFDEHIHEDVPAEESVSFEELPFSVEFSEDDIKKVGEYEAMISRFQGQEKDAIREAIPLKRSSEYWDELYTSLIDELENGKFLQNVKIAAVVHGALRDGNSFLGRTTTTIRRALSSAQRGIDIVTPKDATNIARMLHKADILSEAHLRDLPVLYTKGKHVIGRQGHPFRLTDFGEKASQVWSRDLLASQQEGGVRITIENLKKVHAYAQELRGSAIGKGSKQKK